VTHSEVERLDDIARAFVRWLKSQEISPSECAFVMTELAGIACADMARSHEHLEEGLNLLQSTMRKSAHYAYQWRTRP
jgi:hypothetical protein